jgi:hypothetical protein
MPLRLPVGLPIAACLAILLGGCQAIAISPLAASVAGGGATLAVRYSLDGVTYRTFTAPAAVVKSASLAAIDRMGIQLAGLSDFARGETIAARAGDRDIFIDLEPVSRRATRMRVAARTGGLFYDTATATEIILQTEKILDALATARVIPEERSIAAGATAAPVESRSLVAE